MIAEIINGIVLYLFCGGIITGLIYLIDGDGVGDENESMKVLMWPALAAMLVVAFIALVCHMVKVLFKNWRQS